MLLTLLDNTICYDLRMPNYSKVSTILVDFAYTLCFPKTDESIESLNNHYTELKKTNSANLKTHFIINTQLLAELKKIKSTCSLHIFTSGYMHTDDMFSQYLNPIFESAITTKELGMPKSFPNTYKILANKLSIPIEELLFIDDKIKNVQAAQTAGAVGIQFINTAKTLEELASKIQQSNQI